MRNKEEKGFGGEEERGGGERNFFERDSKLSFSVLDVVLLRWIHIIPVFIFSTSFSVEREPDFQGLLFHVTPCCSALMSFPLFPFQEDMFLSFYHEDVTSDCPGAPVA